MSTCVEFCDDSLNDSLTDCPAFGPVNSSTQSQLKRLQPDPVETSPPADPFPEEPVVEPLEISLAAEPPAEDFSVESLVLDPESPAASLVEITRDARR
jgi:hypothetical protein